jgi:hypothetical protein
MHIAQWVAKWSVDWIIYGCDCLFHGHVLSKYASLAEAYEKLPMEQLPTLDANRLKIVDAALRADFGGSWIGLVQLSKLSLTSRILGFLCEGISIAILVIGFWLFIQLMAQFKKGSIFSIGVSELLSKLAKVIFWFALYVPVQRTILTLIMTFQNPPGQRIFMTSITLNDIFIFAASWFFMILTSLMYEGHKLQEDQDLTV